MEISDNARIWIYQANRPFSEQEEDNINHLLGDFTSQWNAHGHKLAAKAEVRYHRFIILMVDEQLVQASGCSIDKSVHVIRQIEDEFGVNLFDRFNMAYKEDGTVVSCNRAEFEELLHSGRITEETIVFNNTVRTLHELNTHWEVPLKQSWHAQVFA